jgi:hypothetical protein
MKLGSYLLSLFFTSLVCISCASEEFQTCDPLGTWRLDSQDILGCSVDLIDGIIDITDAFCTNLPQGEICRVSEWRFLESNTIEIDLVLIFTFDDDSEMVIETLEWSYAQTDEGRLEICPEVLGICGYATCEIIDDLLVLRLDIGECGVEFSLLSV